MKTQNKATHILHSVLPLPQKMQKTSEAATHCHVVKFI